MDIRCCLITVILFLGIVSASPTNGPEKDIVGDQDPMILLNQIFDVLQRMLSKLQSDSTYRYPEQEIEDLERLRSALIVTEMNTMYKRGVPDGFAAMRGKKNSGSVSEDRDDTLKRGMPNGFIPTRGRKSDYLDYYRADDYVKRGLPDGFVALRGKKDEADENALKWIIQNLDHHKGLRQIAGKRVPGDVFYAGRGKRMINPSDEHSQM